MEEKQKIDIAVFRFSVIHDFVDAGNGRSDYAPVDAAEAVDNYRRILEIVGQVAAETIAPNAEPTKTPILAVSSNASDNAGRGRMPALRAGQAFGHARGGEIGVAIRDWGTFLDPRSRKDWWQGR